MTPDVDGWEVLRRLSAEEYFKHSRVIEVTAEPQDIDNAMLSYMAEVDDYLVKPFRPRAAGESVERVLSKPRSRRGSRKPPG